MQPDDPSAPILALKPAVVQRSAKGAWVSAAYDDVYAQAKVAIAESTFVFLEKNNLPARFAQIWADAAAGKSPVLFTIAELGFGTGLNFLLVWNLWRDIAAHHADLPPAARPKLVFASTEKHPLQPADLAMMQADWIALQPLAARLQNIYPPLVRGQHVLQADADVALHLLFGDAAETLAQFSGPVDAWFLDGFSPAKNPDMWTLELFGRIGRVTRTGGTFSTFSAARAVLEGLEIAGFTVEKVKGFGVKRKMGTGRIAGTAAPALHATPEVNVIGAGIAGAAVAHALAKRGCRVTVYERHAAPALEASGNPRAIIYPKLTVDEAPMGRFNRQAFCFALPLLAMAPGWQACGVLRLDMDEEDAKRSQKIAIRHAYPDDFACAQPETPYGRSALFHARGGMVDPAAFARSLLDHPNIICRFNDDGATAKGITVLCTANAVRDHALAGHLPLRPLRGQVVALAATENSKKITQVVCHEGYITPAVDGLHHAGATFQKEEPESATDHRGHNRATDDLEVLGKLESALRTGFMPDDLRGSRAAYRATTPDKLPMIGPVPQDAGNLHEDLYVAAGFGAHGVTSAPLAGEIIAAMICGGPLPVPLDLLEHLLPQRFLKRAQKIRT